MATLSQFFFINAHDPKAVTLGMMDTIVSFS